MFMHTQFLNISYVVGFFFLPTSLSLLHSPSANNHGKIQRWKTLVSSRVWLLSRIKKEKEVKGIKTIAINLESLNFPVET